jgi:hypothetical protein
MNDGQKLVVTFTKMAKARNTIPSSSRYLIITFKNFIKNNWGAKIRLIELVAG